MKKLTSKSATGVIILSLVGLLFLTIGIVQVTNDSFLSDMKKYKEMSQNNFVFPLSAATEPLGIHTNSAFFHLNESELVSSNSLKDTEFPGFADEVISLVALRDFDMSNLYNQTVNFTGFNTSITLYNSQVGYDIIYMPYYVMTSNQCPKDYYKYNSFSCYRKVSPTNIIITLSDNGTFTSVIPQTRFNNENFNKELSNKIMMFHENDPNLFYLTSVCTHKSIYSNDIVPFLLIGLGSSLILFSIVFVILQTIGTKEPKSDSYEVLTTV